MSKETKNQTVTIGTTAELVGRLAVQQRAQGVCEFLTIMLGDPDGMPSTAAEWQAGARQILDELGIDFDSTYQATLDQNVLNQDERHRAELANDCPLCDDQDCKCIPF